MRLLNRFKADTKGAAAMVFGLTLVPIVGVFGLAVDYGRASATRTSLQVALDATALALVGEAERSSAGQLTAKAQRTFAARFAPREAVSLDPVQVTREGRTIRVSATGRQRTTLTAVLGFSTMPVAAEAAVAWGSNRIELALVLDNTGSMNERPGGVRKMDALQTAAKDLLATLRAVAYEADTVRVSVVPFDTEVRLDPRLRGEDWLRFDSPADRAAWGGYVVDRDQPYDTGDRPAAVGDRASLYRTVRASQWAAWGDLAPVRPLTSLNDHRAYDALNGLVGAMRPRGNTNIGLGVAWGLATLSPGAPFQEAAPAGTPRVKRFMIVLTDGTNTQNHVNGVSNQNTAQIDERTRLACASARSAATVYTIRLVDGNAALLRDCASDPGKYRDVRNPADLSGVFKAIADEITGTVFTH